MSVRISYRYAQSQMFFHRNYNRFSFSKTFRFTTVTRYLSWFFRIRKKKLLESPIHFTLWSTTRSLRYGIPIIFSSLIFFHCHGSARLFRQSARISVRYARWLKLGLFPMIIMFACFCISGRNLTWKKKKLLQSFLLSPKLGIVATSTSSAVAFILKLFLRVFSPIFMHLLLPTNIITKFSAPKILFHATLW